MNKCHGHMNTKVWLREKKQDNRGYSRIVCSGCGKFIGWEKPKNQTKRESKREKASRELYAF